MSLEAPELQVLGNFVGTWDIVAPESGAPAVEGQQTTKWILNGRFIQTTGSVKTDGAHLHVTSLITFDYSRNTYRWWSFMSNGHTEESEGIWNSETQIMKRVTRYGDITQTATSNFATPGIEEWTIVNRDQHQRIISELHGTNSRRAE